jgi:citrate lyase gamma subunit
LQKIPKNIDLDNDNISIISNNEKNHFMKNVSNKNNDIIKNENIEKIDVNEDDFFNDDIIIKNTNHNKLTRNRNNNDMNYYLSTVSNEDCQNTINCVNNVITVAGIIM